MYNIEQLAAQYFYNQKKCDQKKRCWISNTSFALIVIIGLSSPIAAAIAAAVPTTIASAAALSAFVLGLGFFQRPALEYCLAGKANLSAAHINPSDHHCDLITNLGDIFYGWSQAGRCAPIRQCQE